MDIDDYLNPSESIDSDEDPNCIRRMKVPLAGVSDDGSFYGTITKDMREHVDFDELVNESGNIEGYAVIYFKE